MTPDKHMSGRAVVIAALCLLTAAAGCHRSSPPNIVLYVVDTLRADALGCYGNSTVQTPAMDRVAREGLRFERAYANASWTRPSVGSLFTGVYPSTHGAIGRRDALRPGLPLLAEALHARGYRTGAIFANPNIGAAFGFAPGFDDFQELYPARMVHDERIPRTRVGTADNVVNAALAWLQKPRAGPFFLLVFTVDPHAPYEPPPPYDRLYDPDYTGAVDGSIKSVFGLLAAAKLGKQPQARDVSHLRALYHGEVTFNDAQLSRLLAELDRQGVAGETLLLVTSDHGEEFYEHGSGDHGQSLYEELVRIPLLMRWPDRIRPNRVHAGAVQLVDVYPTLLQLGGAQVPPGPGRDLSDVLLGRGPVDIASMAYAEENLDDHNLRMVTLDHRKLIRDAAHPEPLVFDLLRDPGEHHPIAGVPPPDLLTAFEDATRKSGPTPASSPRLVAPTQLPEAVRRAMEALGYGDPAASP